MVISVNGEEKGTLRHNGRILFELQGDEAVTVQIRYAPNDPPARESPIGRFFAQLMRTLLSLLAFFADNDNGISRHRFFYEAEPFAWEKTFRIRPTTDRLWLTYKPQRYDPTTETFSRPDVEMCGAEIAEEALTLVYDAAGMKQAFRRYHDPAYALLFAIAVALLVLMIVCLLHRLTPFDPTGVIALACCSLVVLVLNIFLLCRFISTRRLYDRVDRGLRGEEYS